MKMTLPKRFLLGALAAFFPLLLLGMRAPQMLEKWYTPARTYSYAKYHLPFTPYAFLLMFGATLSVAILTWVLLQFNIGLDGRLSRKLFINAVAYNVIIVIVKFAIAPLALYETNSRVAFDWGWESSATFVMVGIGVFCVYAAFLRSVYRSKGALVVAPIQPVKRAKRQLLIAGLIVAAAIFYKFVQSGNAPEWMAGPLVMILFTGASGLSYAKYVLLSLSGVLIGVLLYFAAQKAKAAFGEAAAESVRLKDVAIYTSFAGMAFVLLFTYHVLWVVFLIAMTTLWPLQITSPE